MHETKFIINIEDKAASMARAMESKSAAIITGMPDSGKTSMALYVAKKYYESHVYMRITMEDRDPEKFCVKLHAELKKKIHRYACPEFDAVVEKSSFDPLLSETHLKMIIKSLKKVLKTRTVLILDDAHNLPDIGMACSAVMSGLMMSGGALNFIICSRRNCVFPDAYAKLNKIAYKIENDFLLIPEYQLSKLALTMPQIPNILSRVPQAAALAEGWLGGILRIFRMIEETGSAMCLTKENLTHAFSESFNSYISGYTHRQIKDMMLLSLPDFFDFGLTQAIDPTGRMSATVNDMMVRNVFIKREGSSAMRFHKLFRLWLSRMAEHECLPEERDAVYRAAAEYELARGGMNKGLDYLTRSGRTDLTENYIKNNFEALIASDAPKNIYDSLMNIKPDEIKKYPWTAMLAAHYALDIHPAQSEKILTYTYEIFRTAEETDGLIFSVLGFIRYYADVAGDLKTASGYYPLLKMLRKQKTDTGKSRLIEAGCAIAAAYLDTPDTIRGTASYILGKGGRESGDHVNIALCKAGLMLSIQTADRTSAEGYCNHLILKLNTCTLSGFQKLSMLISLAHFSSVSGSFGMMRSLIDMMGRKYRPYTEEILKAQAFITAAEINDALVSGELDRAYNLARAGLAATPETMPSHLLALLYLIYAMAYAARCDDHAAEMAEKALKLRAEIDCSPYHTALALYISGAVYTLLGLFKKADQCLNSAIENAENNGFDVIRSGCEAYLSYLYDSVGDADAAGEHAVAAVRMMNKTGISGHTAMLPEVMLNTCRHAVTDRSVMRHAADLAYIRCDTSFDDDLNPIPILKINVLGGLTLSAGMETSSCENMTASFRQMLAVLLSSRDYSIDQEAMQEFLWPETGKDKARRSFDNLISRFRSLLSETFDGLNPKNYVTLNSGILRLNNVRCDADVFISLCRGAWDLYGKGAYRQAADMVIQAEKLFRDRFFMETGRIDIIEQKRRDVDACFIIMLKLMNRLDLFLPDMLSPEYFYDRWLDIFMNETDVVATAYRYYLDKKMTQKASNILSDYTKRLMRDGYSDEEITELTGMIAASAGS